MGEHDFETPPPPPDSMPSVARHDAPPLEAAIALLREVAYVWSGACERKCGRCLECRVAKAAEGFFADGVQS